MVIIRNILSVILGLIIGSVVNLGLVNLGYIIFPVEGLDYNDMEAMAAAMPSFGIENFIFPFLAHALGALTGGFIAALIAASHKMKFAFAIGFLFLLGGIMINMMLPGPIWFTIADIVLAYIPMAWLGGSLAMRLSKGTNQ